MEQMELRETLADIRSLDDPLEKLDTELARAKQNLNEIADSFANAIENDELEAAKEWLRKMQFVQKARTEIESLSAKLEDEQF